MLNKPKFMSPSVNMYDNTTVDLTSGTIPFSCVVDGNEAIKTWQIKVSRLKDNLVVFDTGEKTLNPYFYPVNNRNQNVVFPINLKDSFSTASTYYIKAESEYDKTKVYYKLNNGAYTAYKNNGSESEPSDWKSTYSSLYYTNFVNSSEPYYWSITFSGTNGTVVCSAEEVFYASSSPSVVINYDYDNSFPNNYVLSETKDAPSTLKGRKVYFKAAYTQRENIPIKRYGWRLTDSNSGNVVVDTITQNQIYGITEDISFECGGLVSGNSYLLELYIETQNGQFGIVKSVNFNVSYKVQNLDANFNVQVLNETSGIMLNWGDLKTTEGVVVGKDISFVADSPVKGAVAVSIPEDSSIVFEGTSNSRELEIDENAYVVLSFQIEKFKKSFTILNMSGLDGTSSIIERNLYYNHLDNALEYTITKTNITLFKSIPLSDDSGQRSWYVVVLHPMSDEQGYDTNAKIAEAITLDSLMPNDDVFPAGDVYPNLGDWNKIKVEEDE